MLNDSTIVEIQIAGLNQPDHKGNKLENTLVRKKALIRKIDCQNGIITIIRRFKYLKIDIEVETIIDGNNHK